MRLDHLLSREPIVFYRARLGAGSVPGLPVVHSFCGVGGGGVGVGVVCGSIDRVLGLCAGFLVSTAVHPLLGGGGVESGGLVAGWVCARCWVLRGRLFFATLSCGPVTDDARLGVGCSGLARILRTSQWTRASL